MKTLWALALVPVLFCSCQRSPDPLRKETISVRDDLGRTVTLSGTPSRIVSLAPSITETLFALGLDSSVAGVTEFCDFPARARSKQRIGGIMNPNIERIAALRPDLIILSVSGNARSDFDKLTELQYTVFVTNPKNVEGVFKSIMDLGNLTGTREEAEGIVRRLRATKDSLVLTAANRQKMQALLLLSLSPIIAAGPGSFLDELLSLANTGNVAANAPTAYPMMSREEILRSQPDVIVATSDVAATSDQIASAYPEWKSMRPVREGRVVIVDANLVTRPGPRIIEGLGNLIDAIHETASKP